MPPQCCRCWSDLIEDDERGGSPLEYLNESLRRCKKSKKKLRNCCGDGGIKNILKFKCQCQCQLKVVSCKI